MPFNSGEPGVLLLMDLASSLVNYTLTIAPDIFQDFGAVVVLNLSGIQMLISGVNYKLFLNSAYKSGVLTNLLIV